MQKILSYTTLFIISSLFVGCGGGSSSNSTPSAVVFNETNYQEAISLLQTVNRRTYYNYIGALTIPIDVIANDNCESGSLRQDGDVYTFESCRYNDALINGSMKILSDAQERFEAENINLDIQVTPVDTLTTLYHYEGVRFKFTEDAALGDSTLSAYISSGYWKIDNRMALKYLNFSFDFDINSAIVKHERYFGNFTAYRFSDAWMTVETLQTIVSVGYCPEEGKLKLKSNGSSLTIRYIDDESITVDIDGEAQTPINNCNDIDEYSL